MKLCDSGNILKVKPAVHTEMRGAQEREELKTTPKCLIGGTRRREQCS